MKGFDFAAGSARAALAATRAFRFGKLARADGFDLSFGLRAQFEDIGSSVGNRPSTNSSISASLPV
jgi:hypothetical protein